MQEIKPFEPVVLRQSNLMDIIKKAQTQQAASSAATQQQQQPEQSAVPQPAQQQVMPQPLQNSQNRPQHEQLGNVATTGQQQSLQQMAQFPQQQTQQHGQQVPQQRQQWQQMAQQGQQMPSPAQHQGQPSPGQSPHTGQQQQIQQVPSAGCPVLGSNNKGSKCSILSLPRCPPQDSSNCNNSWAKEAKEAMAPKCNSLGGKWHLPPSTLISSIISSIYK